MQGIIISEVSSHIFSQLRFEFLCKIVQIFRHNEARNERILYNLKSCRIFSRTDFMRENQRMIIDLLEEFQI